MKRLSYAFVTASSDLLKTEGKNVLKIPTMSQVTRKFEFYRSAGQQPDLFRIFSSQTPPNAAAERKHPARRRRQFKVGADLYFPALKFYSNLLGLQT